MRPACAMNAEKLPTLPPTTMSPPLSEMPQRSAASPWITSSPPCAEAPAAVEAKPFDANGARHHVLAHAGPGVAVHGDVGVHVHAAGVVAGVAVDLDVERRVEPGGDGVRAVGIEDLHALARRRPPHRGAGSD